MQIFYSFRKNGDFEVHLFPRSQERESGDLVVRWTFAQNIFETTAVNNTRWHPATTGNFLTYLLGEPFVEFFTAVQHQAFSLGTFFTLCHQSGVVISFKQARHLKNTHSQEETRKMKTGPPLKENLKKKLKSVYLSFRKKKKKRLGAWYRCVLLFSDDNSEKLGKNSECSEQTVERRTRRLSISSSNALLLC